MSATLYDNSKQSINKPNFFEKEVFNGETKDLLQQRFLIINIYKKKRMKNIKKEIEISPDKQSEIQVVMKFAIHLYYNTYGGRLMSNFRPNNSHFSMKISDRCTYYV